MKGFLKRTSSILVAAILALGFAGAGHAAGAFFKVTKIRGKVQVKTAASSRYISVTKGARYTFGSTIKTARNAYADIELSPGNMVRVLSRSKVTVTTRPSSARLIRLKMPEGRVKVSLRNFPKNARFEIETPVGICAAVGTAFNFGVEPIGKAATQVTINCTENAVTFSGELFDADTVAAGGSLTGSLFETAAGWYLRFRCTGKPVTLLFGVNRVTLSAGTSAAVAVGRNAAGAPDFSKIGLKIMRGQAAVGAATVSRTQGSVLVQNNIVTTGSAATALFQTVQTPTPAPEPGTVPAPIQDVPQSPGGVQ